MLTLRALIAFSLVMYGFPAYAQNAVRVQVINGTTVVSATNPLPVSASVSASISGFAPGGVFATLTATGSSASVALPAGAVVVFSNTGTTAVSCTLGIGSATAVASENIIQPGSWFAFTVGSNTFGACIDQTGSASNVIVLSGGTGLPTGSGGGSSSGGGSGVSTADAATFTAGSSLFAGSGGFFQTTATSNALTNGQQGMFQVTATRALFSNLRNAAGTEVGTSAAEVFVGGRGTAGSAAGGVLTIQGVASMTKLLVTPDSVALPANQSVNVSQINGVTPLMGNGVTGTGSPRVTIASDNTAFSVNAVQSGTWTVGLSAAQTLATVTTVGTVTTITGGGIASGAADSGNPLKVGCKYNASPITLSAGNRGDCQADVNGNLIVNVANANTNGQATMANSSPVTIASDQVVADRCTFAAKVNQPISFQTTTLTQQIAASGSNKIYICSMSLIASAATVFSVVGGTGSNCASAQLAILGATSATHGLSLAANGGLTLGNGSGTVAVTAASSEICLVQSGAGDISGNITYVYAP